MSSSFTLSAALAVSGAAFFAGSIVTLTMLGNTGQTVDQGAVTRAAVPDLVAPVTAQPVATNPVIAAPAPAAVQVAAPAATAAQPSLSQNDADQLLAALANSAAAPGAANTAPAAPSTLGNLAIMQQAAANFRAAGGEQSLDQAIRRNAVSDLDRGRATGEIQELLSNAARNGLIAVPEGLTTADGGVDTRSLLFDIVNRAVASTDTSGPAQRPVTTTTAPAAASVTASVTPPKAPTQTTTYTVVSGDSLAFIALKYYGSTAEYRRIYNANRDKLSNPDRISVGQKLVIPAAG